jgi:Ala-tRNA(Pro) deacylase
MSEDCAMAIPEPIHTFLTRMGFEFTVMPRLAADATGDAVVETLAFVADHGPVLTVAGAGAHVDSARLQRLAGSGPLRQATHDEIAVWYPESEPGFMPPLGPFYGQPVFVDAHVARREFIRFSGGTPGETIRMRYVDFAELVHPTAGDLVVPERAPRS